MRSEAEIKELFENLTGKVEELKDEAKRLSLTVESSRRVFKFPPEDKEDSGLTYSEVLCATEAARVLLEWILEINQDN